MRHEPSGLVGDAEHTVQLVRGHALLGRAEKVSGKPPLGQRNLGALEHGADRNRELALAVVAIVQARTVRLLTALDLGNLARRRRNRNAGNMGHSASARLQEPRGLRLRRER